MTTPRPTCIDQGQGICSGHLAHEYLPDGSRVWACVAHLDTRWANKDDSTEWPDPTAILKAWADEDAELAALADDYFA